jgi:nitrite reductase/ring-hydroxylating ferredoxin subunit
MAEIYAGPSAGFDERRCRLVSAGGREVGIRLHEGVYVAYENRCLHQGGPVCEGLVVGLVEESVGPGGESTGRSFSTDEVHLVCPWHAFEYDLSTGELVTDRRRKLRRYEVVVRDEELFLVV